MAFKDNKTVGEEVSNILRLAKVKFDESTLKECGMDWQAPLEQQQEDRYNLTITTKDKTVTVNTTNPEDIIHLMKLGGMDVGSHTVEPAPAAEIGFGSGELTGLGLPGTAGEPAMDEIPVEIDLISAGDEEGSDEEESDEDEDEDDVEESGDWANTPAGSDGQQRSHGDIADQSAAGTGEGNKTYGQNKAPGQGDNPLAYESMMESYKQFKAESADMDKIPAYIRKAKGKSQETAQKEIDKLNDKAGAKVWSSPRLPKDKTNEEAKPDFLDVDKDGDKKEPMKKAIKDKKEVKEATDHDSFAKKIISAIDQDTSSAVAARILSAAGIEKDVVAYLEWARKNGWAGTIKDAIQVGKDEDPADSGSHSVIRGYERAHELFVSDFNPNESIQAVKKLAGLK